MAVVEMKSYGLAISGAAGAYEMRVFDQTLQQVAAIDISDDDYTALTGADIGVPLLDAGTVEFFALFLTGAGTGWSLIVENFATMMKYETDSSTVAAQFTDLSTLGIGVSNPAT